MELAVARSEDRLPQNKPVVSACSSEALVTVVLVTQFAVNETSNAKEMMSFRENNSEACAVKKAETTPEPVPISARSGLGDVEGNRDARKATSDFWENASRRRYESSLGG